MVHVEDFDNHQHHEHAELCSRSSRVPQETNFCLKATGKLLFSYKLNCWACRISWLDHTHVFFKFLIVIIPLHLCMMSRPWLMSIYTPFREPWTQIFQEERNVVDGISWAMYITIFITLCSTGWVKVRHQVNWTVRSGVFRTSKVKHAHCFGIKHTHYLWHKLRW